MRRKNGGDSQFYTLTKNKKLKLIHSTTTVTADFIYAVAEMYPQATVYELWSILQDKRRFIRDREAIAVLDDLIRAGLGETKIGR